MPKLITNYKQLAGPDRRRVIITSDGEEFVGDENTAPDDAFVYVVRGLSPKEQMILTKLLRLPPAPVAPFKPKQVTPLTKSGRIDPEKVHDEMYQDFNDPDYLKALKEYEDLQTDRLPLTVAFVLTTCVEGLDVADEDIQKELGETPYKNDPNDINTFRNRMTQVADILLPRLDPRHVIILHRNIDRLTGVRSEDINFTSNPFVQ